MEYAIFKALLFAVALLDGVYLGVLAHGLGHAIMALILTRQSVIVKVGTLGEVVGLSMGRLTLKLGLKGFRYGSTSYDRQSESVSRQRLIILGGPLVTLFLTIAFGSSLARFDPWGWIWVALINFFWVKRFLVFDKLQNYFSIFTFYYFSVKATLVTYMARCFFPSLCWLSKSYFKNYAILIIINKHIFYMVKHSR